MRAAGTTGTLHTVARSPFERAALASCLRVARPGASLLLMEDAVYAALAGTAVSDLVGDALARIDVYVLEPDLAARGVADAERVAGVRAVDYGGFVDLAVAHDRVVSWP